MSKVSFGQSPFQSFKINQNNKFSDTSIDPCIFPEYLMNLLSNLHMLPCLGKKIQICVVQLLENPLNLEIFTRVPLQAKLSSKFLSPPPSLIQIHVTAIKHKQS